MGRGKVGSPIRLWCLNVMEKFFWMAHATLLTAPSASGLRILWAWTLFSRMEAESLKFLKQIARVNQSKQMVVRIGQLYSPDGSTTNAERPSSVLLAQFRDSPHFPPICVQGPVKPSNPTYVGLFFTVLKNLSLFIALVLACIPYTSLTRDYHGR